MISQTAEYALRAIVWLASHPDGALGRQAVARATHVPPGYLSKVLQALGRASLVNSRPGRNGGFVLLRPPEAITILEVISAVSPIGRIRRCPLGLASHDELCPLHRRLDAALAHVEQVFASTTVADLLGEPSSTPPLCECVARQPGRGAGTSGDAVAAGRRRRRSPVEMTGARPSGSAGTQEAPR